MIIVEVLGMLLEITASYVVLLLIVFGLVIVLVNDFAFFPLAVIHDRLQEKYRLERFPSVSVIVPAHNEERVIKGLIETLMEQTYKKMEIIVVNDGSNDNTKQVLMDYVEKGLIRLIDIPPPNLGKFGALNAGIRISSGEIIVVVDADGLLERNAIARLVAPFEKPDVVAVAGNVKVGNRIGVLTKCQALEYVRDINLPRRALDLLDISIVMPGPLSAFRNSYVRSLGFYDPDTVTEDFDLSVKIHKARDNQRFVARNLTTAVVYTEAPEKIRDLFRQRYRWYGGMAQTVKKHMHERFFWGAGAYSLIGVPYILVSLFVVPITELVITGLSILIALTGGLTAILPYFLVFVVFETVASMLAVVIDKEDWRLVVYSPLFAFGYRQLLDAIKVYSFVQTKIGRMKWTRVRRYGQLAHKLGKS